MVVGVTVLVGLLGAGWLFPGLYVVDGSSVVFCIFIFLGRPGLRLILMAGIVVVCCGDCLGDDVRVDEVGLGGDRADLL